MSSWVTLFSFVLEGSGDLAVPFWHHFGGPWGPIGVLFEGFWGFAGVFGRLGRQDPLVSFTVAPFLAILAPKGSPRGSQHGAKIVKNVVLEAPCFKGGSQEASRAHPGSILERFWNHFGTIFVIFSDICLVMFACIL